MSCIQEVTNSLKDDGVVTHQFESWKFQVDSKFEMVNNFQHSMDRTVRNLEDSVRDLQRDAKRERERHEDEIKVLRKTIKKMKKQLKKPRTDSSSSSDSSVSIYENIF